jgi:CDP-diacylglycerol--glycerol-3-phosphate 3-phosphatidyltransferase
MQRTGYYIVNAITVYRLLAAFVLLYFILNNERQVFKWLLAISFLTDAIDGILARKLKVVSVTGSRLDSIADDLTVLMAVVAIFIFKPEFLRQQGLLVLVMLGLYLVQLALALFRYGRLSSFHTYLAKAAAILQALFLVLFFFLPEEPVFVFYAAAAVTILGLAEEIVLVILLPRWHTDVKGLWWIKRQGL